MRLTLIFTSIVSWLFPDDLDKTILLSKTSPETLLATSKLAQTVLLPNTLAVFSYQDQKIKNLIWSLKYHHNVRAGSVLGKTLAIHVAEEIAERQQFETFETPVIIPVPLHPKRERERGYNQSLVLAHTFAEELSLSKEYVQPDLLLRTTYTESLARGTSRKQRYEHMCNVFYAPKPELIKNKDVILIDDVITSGATITDARRALQKAGARNILSFAIAH